MVSRRKLISTSVVSAASLAVSALATKNLDKSEKLRDKRLIIVCVYCWEWDEELTGSRYNYISLLNKETIQFAADFKTEMPNDGPVLLKLFETNELDESLKECSCIILLQEDDKIHWAHNPLKGHPGIKEKVEEEVLKIPHGVFGKIHYGARGNKIFQSLGIIT